MVHTQVFKEIEGGEGPNKQKQLWVREIDADGIERLRRPEFFFHGIMGHVKDKWGYHINGWRELHALPIIGAETSTLLKSPMPSSLDRAA